MRSNNTADPARGESCNKKTSPRRSFLRTASFVGLAGVAGCLGGSSGDGGSDGSSSEETSTQTLTPSLEERAKEEGALKIATTQTGIEPIIKDFESDYGIQVNVLRAHGQELYSRLIQEQQAGKLNWDVNGNGGVSPLYYQAVIQGEMLQELPDVTVENNVAEKGSKGITGKPYEMKMLSPIMNKDMVSDPPANNDELFQDKWSEKMLVDPRDGFRVISSLRHIGFSESEIDEYINNLAGIASLHESHFDIGQMVARGEAPLGATYLKYQYYDFGEPLEALSDLQPFPRTATSPRWGMFKEPPNPNAAELFLKYLFDHEYDLFVEQFSEDIVKEPGGLNKDDWWLGGFEWAESADLDAMDKRFKNALGIEA
ncbi:extracellular solute-binding protein [Halobellus captivus]|uniref:extracellular solute-binding protein n=1 Tax=Halobellus captivus TaxID=2592614 RepID=UPI0011AAF543|nr:extracellular solute-binding protein [Halobellus captivus]